MSQLPPHRHGGDAARPDGDRPAGDRPDRDRSRRLRRFALAAAVLLVGGFAAGTLFGRMDPERAARLVVAEFTVTEDGPDGTPGPDPTFPTTGPQRGQPVCGWLDRTLDPEAQVETVAAGVVLIQHARGLDAEDEAILADLATGGRVAVAPSDQLTADGPTVVATSWRHRMSLDRIDRDLLDAFVTGHADRAPAVTDCP